MGYHKKRTKPLKEKEEEPAEAVTITKGEIFQFLISNGHELENLKYKYTIQQVWLFYEKGKKLQLDNYKQIAHIMGQSSILSIPVDSQKSAKEKQKSWSTFLDTLTWEKFDKKDVKNRTKEEKVKSNTAGLNSLLSLGSIPTVGMPK